MDPPHARPKLQRSASERPAPLRRSSSLWNVIGRTTWPGNDDDNYLSSESDESTLAPPSPALSLEEAKRARKQKLQGLFKQGVGKIMRERASEMDRTAKKGSLYVMDAFAGRLQHGMAAMSTRPSYLFAAFRLQTSSLWMWTIVACSVAHSLMAFIEPRPGKGADDGWLSAGALRAVEASLITVYALDVALKVAYMGLRNYLKKPWQKLMIAIVLILAVDASGLVAVRFARALRPAVLSLRTRSIRRFYTVVSNMLPGFLRVCLPVLFFLLLSASYAALSFGRAKPEFENPSAAGYAIWILMVCADNYETLVNDPSDHPAYIPFIVMVIVVGSMFLLSLLLGVTYDVFIEHTTKQVKSERLKELKGLTMAFATMDPEGTGKLSLVVWNRFLLHLMPRTTEQERALYFEIASGFADNLDVLGFMDLRQVLSYSFVNVNAIERAGNRKKLEKLPPWQQRLLERMEKMLHHKSWSHTVTAVVLADCLFLPHSIPHQGPGLIMTRLTALFGVILLVDQAFQLAEWVRQGSVQGPLRLPGKSMHTKVAGVAVLLHTLVIALLHCPPLLSVTCEGGSFARSLFSNGNGEDFGDFGDDAEGMEMVGVCWADESGAGQAWGGWLGLRGSGEGVCPELDWCTDCFLMLAYTLRLLRCWRLVTLNDTLHDHVDTFFSVVPVFVQTLSFALIVAYAFAMVAMQAFADKAGAFSDAKMALRTTLQLFVGVDFSSVVEDTVKEVGHTALLFFVAYHVVGVLIVFNLLTAIMIQLYGEALNEKSRQGVEEQRKADQELQETLIEHNQKQRVLKLWGRQLTQGTACLNVKREATVNDGREARRMLGAVSKSHVPTEEELEQCQKHHPKVDLLRALREKTRGVDSLRTFERSFYQKIKSTEGDSAKQKFASGETIYHRGDQHAKCFFVHAGVVRLELADGSVQMKEKGEMFGEEAVVARFTTTATAIADGPVECMGLDRATFTEKHGTLENLGLMLLRLQRSGSFCAVDAPPSAGSREGSRRSAFSSTSGRSTRNTFSSMGNSQFEFTASDLQFPKSRRHKSASASRKSVYTSVEEDRGGGAATEKRKGGMGLVSGASDRAWSTKATAASFRSEIATNGSASSDIAASAAISRRDDGAKAVGRRVVEVKPIPKRLELSDGKATQVPPAAAADRATAATAVAAGGEGESVSGSRGRGGSWNNNGDVSAAASGPVGRTALLRRGQGRIGPHFLPGERGGGEAAGADADQETRPATETCSSSSISSLRNCDESLPAPPPPAAVSAEVSAEGIPAADCAVAIAVVTVAAAAEEEGSCNRVAGVGLPETGVAEDPRDAAAEARELACGRGEACGSSVAEASGPAEEENPLEPRPGSDRWTFRPVRDIVTNGNADAGDVAVDESVVMKSPQKIIGRGRLIGTTSPEVSPSSAPSIRKQRLLREPSSRRLTRETGAGEGGSGMSTWSTNSPSPVLNEPGGD